MVTAALIAGAALGYGVFLVVQSLSPAAAPIASTLAEIDAAAGRLRHGALDAKDGDIVRRVGASLRRHGVPVWVGPADLAILGRSAADVLALKTLCALGCCLCLPLGVVVSAMAGGLTFAKPAVVALVLGTAGFFAPDIVLRRRAAARRQDLRFALSAYLDVVALNLAAGRGVNEALGAAGAISDGWAFRLFVQAQANARLTGTTPWHALGDLGREVEVPELRDLAASLNLAINEGATLRTSLASRAESLRRAQLTDAEGRAGEDATSMVLAALLLTGSFVLFVLYPALIHLLGN